MGEQMMRWRAMGQWVTGHEVVALATAKASSAGLEKGRGAVELQYANGKRVSCALSVRRTGQ